jgi:hypothetical protein
VASSVAATHNQTPVPPIRQPVSSIVTAGADPTWALIAWWVGTSAVPVEADDEAIAPAVTLTPRPPSTVEHFPKLNPSP